MSSIQKPSRAVMATARYSASRSATPCCMARKAPASSPTSLLPASGMLAS